MESTDFAAHWPLFARHAMAAPAKRGAGHGRRHRHQELERIALLRELSGGRFGGGPLFGGPHRRGRGRRRRGDVRMAILLLLAEEPRNGYQLMQVIEERSEGEWRPSPGSVYPVLSQLEDEGLVRATDRDGVKLFELTDAGRERATQAEDATPPWALEDDESAGDFRELRRLIAQVAAAAIQVDRAGDERQRGRALETLKDARRTLYRILAEEDDA
jgi:DNA-binding PadR family transcriptional regulator